MCQCLQPRLQARLMSGLSGVKIREQGHTISVSPGQVPWKPLAKGLIGDPCTRGEARNFDSNAKLKNQETKEMIIKSTENQLLRWGRSAAWEEVSRSCSQELRVEHILVFS